MKLVFGLSIGFKNGIHDPIAPKLTNYFVSLGMGLFQTRDLEEGPMELAHLPNNTTFLLSKP